LVEIWADVWGWVSVVGLLSGLTRVRRGLGFAAGGDRGRKRLT